MLRGVELGVGFLGLAVGPQGVGLGEGDVAFPDQDQRSQVSGTIGRSGSVVEFGRLLEVTRLVAEIAERVESLGMARVLGELLHEGEEGNPAVLGLLLGQLEICLGEERVSGRHGVGVVGHHGIEFFYGAFAGSRRVSLGGLALFLPLFLLHHHAADDAHDGQRDHDDHHVLVAVEHVDRLAARLARNRDGVRIDGGSGFLLGFLGHDEEGARR